MGDITLGSLFDGIGVFPLAARRHGIVPLWASEIVKAPTLLLIMQFFPVVQYLVPAYVGNLLDYGEITVPVAGILCLIYGMIVAICVEITARTFERMDLK